MTLFASRDLGVHHLVGLLMVAVALLFPPLPDAQAQSTQVAGPSDDLSLRTVKERGVLIVGTDIPYGVMEFLDDSGNPAGIDVDIAKELAADLNSKLQL